jgi:flagellar hook protein FlgE
MSSSFSIALSALQAESEAIDTTGNNLANMNTVGYKENTVDFATLVSQQLGQGGGLQVGMGVGTPVTEQSFVQGPIQNSSSPTACAIQGNGFFVVNNSANQQLFTRDGDFTINSNGMLVTQTGETVQGWTAVDSTGNILTSGQPGNVVLPSGQVLPASTTTKFTMTANLDASTAVNSSWTQAIPIVDSLGNTHNLNATFTNTGTNQWTYEVRIPKTDVVDNSGANPSSDQPLCSSGTITFDQNGNISEVNGKAVSSATPPITLSLAGSGYKLADGASFGDSTNNQIVWTLVNSSGTGTLTQYAEASGVETKTVDGSQPAELTGFSIQNGGLIVATFSNGQQKTEGQVALANIQNPDSLQSVGNNNFQASGATSTPAVGLPLTGGRGQILGGSLEGSTVDMATEFTKLITYQSGYQASSRVITVADQMTQDLMNLIH